MIRRLVSVFALALLFIAPAATAFAQNSNDITLGVTAGVNSSTVSGPADTGTTKDKRKAGVFGAFMNVNLGGYWDFQQEFLYSMEGAKLAEIGGTGKATAQIDMFRVNPLVRFGPKPAQNGAYCCYFIAGPSFGLVSKAKVTMAGAADEDLKSDLKRGELALVGGVGLTIKKAMFEVRYTGGLTNLNKDADEKNKSRVLSVMFGYKF
jgi:hypothetical protein